MKKKQRIITDRECRQAAKQLKSAAKHRKKRKTLYPFGFEYKKTQEVN